MVSTLPRIVEDVSFYESCRLDPNLFIEFVLGVNQAPVHVQFQEFLSSHTECYAELHRGIGKTTQIAPGRIAWEIGRNPDLRVKYVQQTDGEAEKTCGLIRDVIESDRYRAVFPSIRPDYDCWGKSAIKVRRNKWSRDPTLEANGIMGRAGGRADIIVADDVCDLRNAIQMPAEREKVKESWLNNWLPMRDWSAPIHPRTWKVGTCYHVADITADWRRFHAPRGELLRLPVEHYRSPWPSVYTYERLRSIREEVGPIAYARAYELQPVSSEMIIFPAEWLDRSFYETQLHSSQLVGSEVLATFDYAFTVKRLEGDPDYSICIIGAKTSNGHVYVREVIRVRESFPEFKRRSIERCVHHGVRRGAAESNGPQAGLTQQLNEDAPFPVMPLNREKDKVTRAAEQQAFVESGRFHILGAKDQFGVLRPVPSQQILYDELTTFPAGDHDDCVDAAVDMMDLATTSRAPLEVKPIQGKPIPTVDRAVTNRLSRLYGR